jgi:flagellar hook protein FlgE
LASNYAPALAANEVKWATGLGIGAQSIDMSLGAANLPGGITQFDSDSTLLSTSVNGAVLGSLVGVTIDRDGFLTAQFDNGIERRVYQLPLATFINPNGLHSLRGGGYRATVESGNFNLKPPGTGGAGIIQSQALENSNVDLATEFTGLITTQRAYSASSRIITTADEMLDELIRIKR